MEKVQRLLLTLGVVIILILMFYLITNAISRYTGFFIADSSEKEDVKKCLNEKDITLYINSEDPSQTLETINLNEYFSEIKIKNCLRDIEYCKYNEVNKFPTWIIENKKIEGDISYEELLRFSLCESIK